MRWRIYRLRHRNSAPFLPGRGRYSRRYQCEGSSAGCGPDRDQKSTWRWYQMSCFRVVPWCGGVVVWWYGGMVVWWYLELRRYGGMLCMVVWCGGAGMVRCGWAAVWRFPGTIVPGKSPGMRANPKTRNYGRSRPAQRNLSMYASLNKSVTGLALNPMFALILRHCPWLV